VTQDTTIALDQGAFFIEQTHRSGAIVTPESPLDLVRIALSSFTIDFYCQNHHIAIPASTITEIIHSQSSASILCSSASCRIYTMSSAHEQTERLSNIVSQMQLLLKRIKSTEATAPQQNPASHTSKAIDSRPPRPSPDYLKESVHSTPKKPGAHIAEEGVVRQGPKNYKDDKLPSLKRHHSNKEVQDIVSYAAIAHTFQAAYVLEKIVETEVERINNEKSGWKVAGAVAGLALGVSDGFQFTDLFTSIAFSNIGGMAHEFASKEQVEFLKKVKSDWLVSQKSALEILHRLGMPRQRSICYFSQTGHVCIANLHENPSRGSFMVPLGAAKDHATGFKNDDALAVLYNAFEESDINILAYQLYPMELLQLSSQKRISQSKASSLNPYHDLLEGFDDVSLLTLKDDSSQVIAYKVPIPVGSEY
jgi:hypothetical protein